MIFEPLRTERLILRAPVQTDAEAAHARRSLPEVARYQDWELPYTRERAEEMTAKAVAMDGPAVGSGWMITVVLADRPEQIVGDLYVELRWEGRVGYLGYTFHPDHWGQGYASEAAQALVEYLFVECGVGRVESSLDPENPPSARVLEACGMVCEGHTRRSFWVGDECSDDMFYGMLRADWEAWRSRPRTRPESVQLIDVDADNQEAVGALRTHQSQQRFVTPMLGNFRDALAPPRRDGSVVVPWYRAIAADGVVAGFLLATEMTDDHPHPLLWRLLIDRMHQRRGVGSAALDIFEQRCRDRGATAIEVTWGEGPGSPAPLYLGRGYVPSGRRIDGEVHAVKSLI